MESASSRVIATNGAALRIAEGGTGQPALVFLHYGIKLLAIGWGQSIRRQAPGSLRLTAPALEAIRKGGCCSGIRQNSDAPSGILANSATNLAFPFFDASPPMARLLMAKETA